MESTRAAVRTGGVALLVRLPDAETLRFTEALHAVGLDVHVVDSPDRAGALLALKYVRLVVAPRAVVPEVAGIREVASERIPIVATVESGEDETVASALREGASATVSHSLSSGDVTLLLRRLLPAPEPDVTEPPSQTRGENTILGKSEPLLNLLDLISRAAPTLANALVRGETGSGKELVARALHRESSRRDGPFVKVHCAALPESLLESELFGYERGAFTGAVARKPGRVELAEGGTLFLDEIGDISLAVQVKLLRLLQDREFERLGGLATLRANVRFIAATHRDLEGMVKRNEFREDLFYRLNVVTLWVPPLRARRDDVPLLAAEFCAEFVSIYGRPPVKFDDEALKVMRTHRWPGNVRQLRNFVERLVVLAQDPSITADQVRTAMSERVTFRTQITGTGTGNQQPTDGLAPLSLATATRDAERAAIEKALAYVRGNRTAAARILGISRATLYLKLEELGLGGDPSAATAPRR